MKNILRKAAVFSVVLASASFTAMSATVDLGAVELGKIYEIPDFASVTGTFTAPSTGKLTQNGVPDVSIQGLEPTAVGYGEFGQVLEWNVTAGTTYTLSSAFVMSGGKLQYTMTGSGDFQLALVSSTPEEGGIISTNVNGTGTAIFTFNTAVQMTSAFIHAGTSNITLTNSSSNANTIALRVSDAMMQLYSNGSLSPEGGEPVNIVIEGLRTSDGVKYQGTGTFIASFTSAPKAVSMTGKNFNNFRGFKSFYPEGDPEGLLTFTFDGELSPTGISLVIGAGNPEVDTYCYEEVPAVVDGSTVSVDLCGKLRDFTRAISDGEYVSIKLINVKDKNGFVVNSQDGNIGSFSYTFIYDYIEPFDITSEFLPATGSDLRDVSRIEIWFNHADMITYDGVRFVCGEGEGATVTDIPVAELNIDASIATERVILVDVPEAARTQPTTLTLYGLVSLDGYNHSSQIKAEYNQFVVRLLAPVSAGQAIAATGTEPFMITTNRDAAYMRYDFFNHEGASCGGAVFTKQDNGTWTAPNINAVCYQDFTPVMLVRAYESEEAFITKPDEPVESYRIEFLGKTAAFEYSPVTLTAITPEAESEINAPVDADFHFTLYFDGLVIIDPAISGIKADGGLKPFAKLVPADTDSEANGGYSGSWEVYPDAAINSLDKAILVIAAFDMDGYLVEGTTGGYELDRIVLSYTINSGEGGIGSVTVDTGTGDVYNLQGIRILQGAESGDISRLTPGLYIINGKKTLVK